MYNQRYQEIGTATISHRIDIFDYVRDFISSLGKLEREKIRFNDEFEAMRVKGLLNSPSKTRFKSVTDPRSDHPYWERQEVDYVPSNLGSGRGYLFYFLCNRCDRRVKYLYFYSEIEPPLCRTCCQIPYRPASYQSRKLSQLRKLASNVNI